MARKNINKKNKQNKITTIKISKETKTRLDHLKEHERETYEQVLKKVLYVLNLSKKDPQKAQRLFKRLDSIIERRKYSEVYSEEKEE